MKDITKLFCTTVVGGATDVGKKGKREESEWLCDVSFEKRLQLVLTPELL